MKNRREDKVSGPVKPSGWPVEPTPVTVTVSSASFPQTGLRSIEGKPPFMRCLLHTDLMAVHGLHADLPVLIENAGKHLILHAWPSPKAGKSDISLDDTVIKYLDLSKSAKIKLNPVVEFVDADRIVLANCPDTICKILPSVYDGIVVAEGSVVFFGGRQFTILSGGPETAPYFRVTSQTAFVSSVVSVTAVPKSLEPQFNQIQQFITSKPRKSFIIHGPSGSGKTVLTSAIVSQNSTLSFALFSVPSVLSGTFGAAERALRAARNRDVIILENMEVLSSDDVSRRLIAAIATISEHTTIVATTTDIESFPRILRQGGRITESVELQAPSAEERELILKQILTDSGVKFDETDVKSAATAATGFVGGDLQRLCSEAIIDSYDGVLSLSKALNRVKPASLRHISLEIPTVRWTDIGGYEDVKQKLKESVTLPLERPEAFTRLGVRPPRGVLLFGPPGCSKTLMAKAVATESRMNFIAVKGPELFSKFVGESEKAVAGVFKKARAAAPSIVFFDEVDAMATRRGSGLESGSNVTDRVLTQLLTEMDGVSTKFEQSVVVIAATNRPDLLDSALLRPGRFDRLVYVSLPNEAARKEIFRVHMAKMRFAEGIDIDELAKKTEGYSGAEIAAVCREAAMNALREEPPADVVEKRHVEKSLETVKPRTPKSLLDFYASFEAQRKY